MCSSPIKFPKIQSPYQRSYDDNNRYTIDPIIREEFQWVFNMADQVEAVEKLHGQNIAVKVRDNNIIRSAKRNKKRNMKIVEPYSTENAYIVRGIQNSMKRFRYLEKDIVEDGWYFGEVVGPAIQGNPYELDEHLFVPFDWLRRKATYKSFGDYSVQPEAISDWLQTEIVGLFYSLMHGVDFDQAAVKNKGFVEGVVFIHPQFDGKIKASDLQYLSSSEYDVTTNMFAKVRRNMYQWYNN